MSPGKERPPEGLFVHFLYFWLSFSGSFCSLNDPFSICSHESNASLMEMFN